MPIQFIANKAITNLLMLTGAPTKTGKNIKPSPWNKFTQAIGISKSRQMTQAHTLISNNSPFKISSSDAQKKKGPSLEQVWSKHGILKKSGNLKESDIPLSEEKPLKVSFKENASSPKCLFDELSGESEI